MKETNKKSGGTGTILMGLILALLAAAVVVAIEDATGIIASIAASGAFGGQRNTVIALYLAGGVIVFSWMLYVRKCYQAQIQRHKAHEKLASAKRRKRKNSQPTNSYWKPARKNYGQNNPYMGKEKS